MIEVVEIPYRPRQWAKKLHASTKRWSVLVLHRRAGKTTAVLNHHQRAAMDNAWEMARLRAVLPNEKESYLAPLLRSRIYWHVMPTIKQARIVAWDILKFYAEPIPGVKFNNTEMSVIYPTGNKIQLLGADDPDSLRGPGLSGLSLDEYSQISVRTFGEVLSKALGEHLGYCIFGGTIIGKDQLYDIYQSAKDNPEWYAVWQDIDASLATEHGPTITALTQAVEDDRKLVLAGAMLQAEFDQEWYLSPEAAVKGAIYAKEMEAARGAGRITKVPYDPALPVDTDWDIGGWGGGDSTAIWFSQSTRSGEVRLIDYHEASGEGIQAYASVLRTKGYSYGKHWGPHDIAVHEMDGRSRMAVAKSHGITFELTPRIAVATGRELEEGIHAARMLFARCWFDETLCRAGIEALQHYRRDYNERLNEFKATPVHDWSSHGADAFRGLAVRHRVPRDVEKQARVVMPREWTWS